MNERPVVVVTGGGGGIGAAIAEALGRQGSHVVTLDPLVTLDGSAVLPPEEETTAARIVAAGGSAQSSSASVADGPAVHALFAELVAEHGHLDAVINVAGITRPTGFATGSLEDWRSVLEVHLDGYRHVLEAALPIMAAAGHGRILGVTSGSGWRAADAGAYSCAKRAVAALTWELGRHAPPGVTINAISPIAVTRMVTAALGRTSPAGAPTGAGSSTGGLSLGSMPTPDQLGPLGAHLVSDAAAWLCGRVVFAGGAEVAIIQEPRLLEVVRTEGAPSLPELLAQVVPVLAATEAAQATTGGSNPRLPDLYDTDADTDTDTDADADGPADGSGGDAADVAIVTNPRRGPDGDDGWSGVLREHEGIVDGILADAAAARSAADRAATGEQPVRLVTLTDATTAGGRSRAQAAAQLAAAARKATGGGVTAFAISVEGGDAAMAVARQLADHLAADHPGADALAGAELVAGDGWLGLRSHPHPTGSITFGGPGVPPWFDAALRGIVG